MKLYLFTLLALLDILPAHSQPPIKTSTRKSLMEDLVTFYNGMARVKENYKYGIIKGNGDYAVAPFFEYMDDDLSQKLILVKKDGKYGYIDISGKFVIEPRYKNASAFYNGYAPVRDDPAEMVLIDEKGNIAFRYKGSISTVGDNGWVAVSSKGSGFKYVDLQGNQKLDGNYYQALDFNKGKAIVATARDVYQLIDEKGNVLSKSYNNIKRLSSGLFLTEGPKKGSAIFGPKGLLNADGKELLPPVYESVYAGEWPVGVKDSVGNAYFIDSTSGKRLFNTTYEQVSSFYNGAALVSKDGQVYYIDRSGKTISQPLKGRYDFFDMGGGYIRLYALPYWVIIDPKTKTEKKVLPARFEPLLSIDGFVGFSNGATKDRYFGLMNDQGNIILEAKYPELRMFEKGYAALKDTPKGGYKIISPDGKFMFNETEYENVMMGDDYFWIMAKGAKLSEAYYMDVKGKKMTPPVDYSKYQYALQFINGLAVTKNKDNLFGFIDMNGKEVIKCQYEDARSFGKDGLALVKKLSNWGIIDKTGKTIIPCDYAEIKQLKNGVTAVLKSGKWTLYNLDKPMMNAEYESVLVSGNGLIPVKNGKNCEYIDSKGKEIIPMKFSEAGSFSNGIAFAVTGFKYGFINTKGDFIIAEKYYDAFVTSTGVPIGKKIEDNVIVQNPMVK